jgi:hypothetical protein
VRVHRALVHELLDFVQRRFVPLDVKLDRLFRKSSSMSG